ncbi:hypothetical protein TNCV_1171021, partial [Trichonephila clavipes]
MIECWVASIGSFEKHCSSAVHNCRSVTDAELSAQIELSIPYMFHEIPRIRQW